jgi:hypothetical protein
VRIHQPPKTPVQLALLKFPGRTLMEVKEVPQAMLNVIAELYLTIAPLLSPHGKEEQNSCSS